MSHSFVVTIDLALSSKLQNDLLEKGFKISIAPHTLFCAQKQGLSCTLYESGKLVIQGKDKDSFITFYLEPEILGRLDYSHPELSIDLIPRIGSDEAGKGDFFGPLCIASVFADKEKILKLLQLKVRDSKKMADYAILNLAKKIEALCPHSIVRIFPEKYNLLYEKFQNLNHLLAWAHTEAIAELITKTGCHTVLLDQFTKAPLVEKNLHKRGVSTDFTQRVRAEEDPVVAAASILARAAFIEGLVTLSQSYPFITLPKGASSPVIECGKQLIQKHGPLILNKLAKIHFKTKDSLFN
jgi:ribonuclease HIII